ncbi:hypothetical protein BDW22DRAFT_1363638 [Trametopsis cervina]|nr:hypothetical protein BDW22DRAFT_1363638 [Trametopsis cervina]
MSAYGSSRRPAPASSAATFSRTGNFQPPSFYAAAAGLQYSPKPGSSMPNPELNSAGHNHNGAPLCYPTAGTEDQEPEPGSRRSNSFSRSFSRTKSQRNEKAPNTQDRRKSQMAELPFLETQLLPSLRDTIDRMTHPHRPEHEDSAQKYQENRSFQDGPPPTPRAARSGPSDVRGTQRTGQSSIPSSPYASAMSSVLHKYPTSNPSSPAIPNSPAIWKQAPSSTYHTPRLESQTPSTRSSSKLPTTARNAAVLSPASVSVPVSPLPGRSPGRPSKIPKGDALSAPSPNSKLRSPNLRSPSKLPTPSSPYPTPNPDTRSTTPRARQVDSPYQSTRTPASYRPSVAQTHSTTDSGSELEHEYNRSLGGGRLVVANAEIFPSSSESDAEHAGLRERRQPSPRSNRYASARSTERGEDRSRSEMTRRDDPAVVSSDSRRHRRHKSRKDRASVGLGLRFDSDNPPPDATRDRGFEAYPDPGYDRGRREEYPQQHTNAYSHPQADERDYKRSSGLSEGRRRREALVGLVNGLQHEYGDLSGDNDAAVQDEDDSHSEIGAVVATPSMELEDDNRTQRAYDQHGYTGNRANDREEYYDTRRTDQNTRNHSNSQQREAGHNRRSSSLPPGAAKSALRQPGPGRSAQRQEQNPEPPRSSKQTKSRHRMSMSMDQSKATPRQGSSRSNRNSVQKRDSGTDQRPNAKRRDSAAREREAFGIPASLSYGGIDREDAQDAHEQHPRQEFARTTSDTEISTVTGDDLVSSEGNREILSVAATALFDKLSGTPGARADAKRDDVRSRSGRQYLPERREEAPPERYQPQNAQASSSRPKSIVESSSAPSVYEPEPEIEQHHEDTPVPQSSDTWRSTMRPKVYDRLLSVHGPTEMERQEIIFRYFRSQQQLLYRLKATLRVFVLPLRRQHSKTWIPGVPTAVGRLFDWLEDIINLHSAIAETLTNVVAPWESGTVVLQFAKPLQAFVPKLEVYQPYLVRYEQVRGMISQHVAAANDQFGEFVKMQQKRKECEGWTLTDLLEQPVSYLSTSLDTFEHLWELTPTEHPDHLSAFSLYHSTRMIIHVLWEVKLREEEYDYVKHISTKIEGLLPSVQLATRERRLLWHGDLTCQTLEQHSRSGSSSKQASSAVLSPGGNRAGPYATPAIVVSPCPEDTDRYRGSASEDAPTSKPVSTRVFVFTDVVMIGRTLTRQRASGAQWKLIPDVGTARVLRVISPHTESDDHFKLELLPLNQHDLQSGMIPHERSVIVVDLSPPTRLTDSERATATNAFRRCHAYTLRSLSFPSHSGQYLPHGAHLDLEQDTQRSVMAILSTGLPLPKSPSIQMADTGRAGTADPSTDHDREREERGWWALRFQQVLREMQRQDPMASLQALEIAH